jgi:hypothetical protein
MSDKKVFEPDKAESIIDAHRRAIIMSGQVSDFQLENLQKWPFLLFNDLEKNKISYDFTAKEIDEIMSPGKVSYDFKFKQEVDKASVAKQLDTLTTWVKFLFWKQTEVEFLKDGKEWI